jgi:hypothetical protein
MPVTPSIPALLIAALPRRGVGLVRFARLPDFSRGDAAARRHLDALVPGWSSPTNTSRLAEALRCSVFRHLRPGERLSSACR